MEATLDRFGRILIPKPLRDALGLRPGARLRLEASGDGIDLRPIDVEPALTREHGVLVFRGELTGDAAGLLTEIREERIRRLGGR